MILQGQIVDKTTGEGIPSVSVQVVDQFNNPTGQGVAADSNGNFSFSANVLPGYSLLLTDVGYQSLIIDSNLLAGGSVTISMTPSADRLPDAGITAKKPNKLGAVLGLLLLSGTVAYEEYKTRKHGKVTR